MSRPTGADHRLQVRGRTNALHVTRGKEPHARERGRSAPAMMRSVAWCGCTCFLGVLALNLGCAPTSATPRSRETSSATQSPASFAESVLEEIHKLNGGEELPLKAAEVPKFQFIFGYDPSGDRMTEPNSGSALKGKSCVNGAMFTLEEEGFLLAALCDTGKEEEHYCEEATWRASTRGQSPPRVCTDTKGLLAELALHLMQRFV